MKDESDRLDKIEIKTLVDTPKNDLKKQVTAKLVAATVMSRQDEGDRIDDSVKIAKEEIKKQEAKFVGEAKKEERRQKEDAVTHDKDEDVEKAYTKAKLAIYAGDKATDKREESMEKLVKEEKKEEEEKVAEEDSTRDENRELQKGIKDKVTKHEEKVYKKLDSAEADR